MHSLGFYFLSLTICACLYGRDQRQRSSSEESGPWPWKPSLHFRWLSGGFGTEFKDFLSIRKDWKLWLLVEHKQWHRRWWEQRVPVLITVKIAHIPGQVPIIAATIVFTLYFNVYCCVYNCIWTGQVLFKNSQLCMNFPLKLSTHAQKWAKCY